MAQTKTKALLAKRRFWKKHVENWQASELIQSEYCRHHNLKVHRFIYWKKKFSCSKEMPASLVQIPLAKFFQNPIHGSQSLLRVTVNEKFKIEVEPGFDPTTLQQLIHSLGRL